MTLFLATSDGLVIAGREGDSWQETGRTLQGQEVTSVIAREGVILAGTTAGVFRSDDLGANWTEASTGLEIPHVRWLAYHPDISDREFAGTEPAGIFISHDGAESWRGAPEVPPLRDRFNWFLPYSPEAGAVRGFAFHGRRVYAAVEVGGVLRSDDGGETWQLAAGSDGQPRFGRPAPGRVHPDVHSIEVHLSSPDLVVAPTGGGLYRSNDGGRTWACLYECYCRAVWLDPQDPDHLIFGPADSVDHDGRIEESHDGGRTWQTLSAGLDTPWRRHMVERFTAGEGHLFAVLSNGQVLCAAGPQAEWEYILPSAGHVHALTTMG